jgi:Chromate transporter
MRCSPTSRNRQSIIITGFLRARCWTAWAWRKPRRVRSSWCCSLWALSPPIGIPADCRRCGPRRSADYSTWVTFTPCFLWIFVGAPYIETLRGNKGLAGALGAITAAVVGVILNLSVWFALHTLFRETTPVRSFGLSFDLPVISSVDLAALVLAIAAATAIFRFNAGMLTVLGGASAAGIALRLAGLI